MKQRRGLIEDGIQLLAQRPIWNPLLHFELPLMAKIHVWLVISNNFWFNAWLYDSGMNRSYNVYCYHILVLQFLSSCSWTSYEGYNPLTSANRRKKSGGTWLFRMASSRSRYTCQPGAKYKDVGLEMRLWVRVRSVSESPSCLSSHRIRDSGSPWGNIGLGAICHLYSKTRWRSETRISPVTWDPVTVLTRSIAPPVYPSKTPL